MSNNKVYIANNKIIEKGTSGYYEHGIKYPVIKIEVSDELYQAYCEDSRKVIYQDGQVVLNPDYEEIRQAEYQDMINHLTMTALDFINVLKQAGITDEQIEVYLNNNLSVKHQLQYCQNVYCGVAKALMPITVGDITITAELVEVAFKAKHGVQ